MRFYTALFNDSGIDVIRHHGANGNGAEGALEYGLFRLANQEFMAIDSNHAHDFAFNEAISFEVSCDTQAEVDHFWNAMSAHPQSEQCGWLQDKYGVSWQIVPKILGELMNDPDPEKSRRVMEAMLKMKKFDIDGLKQAYMG
jgi:predicted 3-demethylubiquinone-9 3-methyltransferase (glyoxalase superfamily)